LRALEILTPHRAQKSSSGWLKPHSGHSMTTSP
jgi:hypothetical protein